MTEREFIEFVTKIVKWAQKKAEEERLPYTSSPMSRDWRELGNFGLFENSAGELGFAVDWESDGKRGDKEVFIVRHRPH